MAPLRMFFLKWISRFTDNPIPLGTGVSTDDTVLIPVEARDIESIVTGGNFFTLRKIDGPFEFVNFIKSGDSILYQLKHKYSGETFNISKNMLDFFFEKNNS